MALAAGRQLGQYEGRELIGQGGMCAAYKAEDTRLGLNLALKLGKGTQEVLL